MWKLPLLAAAAAVLTLAGVASPLASTTLRANDTALHEGAYGPEPVGGGFNGPESIVRMESERLEISMGRKTTTVRARFVFRSGKTDAPAQQLVGFPDLAAGRREGARRAKNLDAVQQVLGGESDLTGPLEEVQTLVDGRETKSELRYGYVREVEGMLVPATPNKNEDTQLVAWHAVPVSFPPGQDVVIERRYRVNNGQSVAIGRQPTFFDYTTATGGVWRGTIGELVADVQLRDGLTTKELIWDAPSGTSLDDEAYPHTRPARGEWEILAPNHLRLVWRDFEPRTEKNHRGLSLWIETAPAEKETR